MSNIIRRPESILTRAEQQLTDALLQPKLMDLSPQQKDAANVALIGGVYANVNEKNPDAAVLMKMKSDLRELMDTEFKAMRIEEIKIALDYGSDNWDGHGVSSKLIKNWIRTWRQTKKLEIQRAIIIKNKRTMIEEPKEYTNKQKLESIQNQFKVHLRRQTVSTFIYPYLKGFNLLNDVKMIWAKVDLACDQYQKETKENKNQLLANVRKVRFAEIKAVKERKHKEIPTYIRNRAERLVIEQVFNDMVAMDQTPETIIEL